MPKKPKEPVEKVCEYCGNVFKTKYPQRAKYCPGSKCRSKAWDEEHRVQSREALEVAAVRKYWRVTKARWRRKRREATAGKGKAANA